MSSENDTPTSDEPGSENAFGTYVESGRKLARYTWDSVKTTGDHLADTWHVFAGIIKKRRLSGSIREAEISLGEQLARAGLGDAKLRSQLEAIDERIENVKSADASPKNLLTERKGILRRIFRDANETANEPAPAATARRSLCEVQEKLQQNATASAAARGRLVPSNGDGWKKLGVGYVAVFLVLYLGAKVVLSAFSASPNIATDGGRDNTAENGLKREVTGGTADRSPSAVVFETPATEPEVQIREFLEWYRENLGKLPFPADKRGVMFINEVPAKDVFEWWGTTWRFAGTRHDDGSLTMSFEAVAGEGKAVNENKREVAKITIPPKTMTPPRSAPSVRQNTVASWAEVMRQLELRGYTYAGKSSALGMTSIEYVRQVRDLSYKATILRWIGDDRPHTLAFRCEATGSVIRSPVFRLNAWFQIYEDANQMIKDPRDYLRAWTAARKVENSGLVRSDGRVTTGDGWQIHTIEYLEYIPARHKNPVLVVELTHLATSEDMPVSALVEFNTPSLAINNIKDDRIEEAVGLLVAGAQFRHPNGSVSEAAQTTGSCFAITPDGYLLTNSHITEFYDNAVQAKAFRDWVFEEEGVTVIPKLWVFFAGEQYAAELLHSDQEYDLSILKIDRDDRPFLRLATQDEATEGTDVFALGFPLAASAPLSKSEIRKKLEQLNDSIPIKQRFRDDEFDYTMTKGIISRVTFRDGIEWIQHNADINRGNSGGPLITNGAAAVGINTLQNVDAQGVSFSFTIRQLSQILSEHGIDVDLGTSD